MQSVTVKRMTIFHLVKMPNLKYKMLYTEFGICPFVKPLIYISFQTQPVTMRFEDDFRFNNDYAELSL